MADLGAKNILITSALPYVNNIPHLGNIIGSVLSGDVFARYCRLQNHNVLYICGTDEYGTATETKALQEGVSPREICNKYHKIHKEVYDWFNIKFDYFGRTSTKEQTDICQDMFLKLKAEEYILTDFMDQWRCNQCKMYLADRYVMGVCPKCKFDDARGDQCDGCGRLMNAMELQSPRCKLCNSNPIVNTSTHYFLDLPKMEPLLKSWMAEVSGEWSPNAKAIAETWVKEGLKTRCITRDLKWGVPVPEKEFSDKVFYVWFDAPLGYISITKEFTSEWRKWWLPEEDNKVELVQFMAKDNVPFHSVMFPSCLLATQRGYTTVTKIFATEYLNYEGAKFSKSRGTGVFGTDVVNTNIPSDIWRFYLLFIRPETQDSNFSWKDFVLKNNSELLNNIGNFVLRTLKFIESKFACVVPEVNLQETDKRIISDIDNELIGYMTNMESGKLRESLRNILSISHVGNKYFQTEKPWELHKGTNEDQQRSATVLGLCCNIVCCLSLLLEPYMPSTAEELRKQLCINEELKFTNKFTIILKGGTQISKPKPLFKKIDESEILKWQVMFTESK